jgi:RimK family alpha-L-glutamate ligase
MKVTLIEKEKTWHGEQLINQGKKMNIDVERIDIHSLTEISVLEKKIGDVIFWRSSSLDIKKERAISFKFFEKKGKTIINNALLKYPNITDKLFQQKYIEICLKSVQTIPTYFFKSRKELLYSIERKKIIFPFILKPNLGARGEGILLIEDSSQLDKIKEEIIKESVFQNYIENDGDFRVLMLGGYPLGIIKRVAKNGSFLNNVSKGGVPIEVKDEKIKEELFRIAIRVVALFDLKFCGVDIIYNKKDDKFYFLELNTVPQWEGFQKTTRVNVAKELLSYCDALKRKEKPQVLVEEYYKQHLVDDEKKFHFLSRLFLWTKQKKYFQELEKLEEFFIGLDGVGNEKKIKELLKDKESFKKKVYNGRSFRKDIIKKYPLLGSYHEILFRNLMSKNIFGKDLRRHIRRFVKNDNLKEMRNELLKNKKDILKLSTFAVNFLYFLRDYLDEDDFVLEEVMLDIASQMKVGDNSNLSNNIYLLTHCVIGESRFYNSKILSNKIKTYKFISKKAEELILSAYFEVSLDSKLEFLICCKLVGYKTKLEFIIQDEASYSFSELGNFIIDKRGLGNNNDFLSSEHRSVLYILSNIKKMMKV